MQVSDFVTNEYFLFEVGGCVFGMKMDYVEEVVPVTRITPVPRSASFVVGLASVRGKIMSVIDASKRLKLRAGLRKYFLLCLVRGNLTAIVIDRPIEVNEFGLRPWPSGNINRFLQKIGLDPKFTFGGWQMYRKPPEDAADQRFIETKRTFIELNPDQFVSDQMASQVERF